MKGGLAPTAQRKHLEYETDPDKLVKCVVGGNIYKEGQDPEVKPNSEYPDWLWTLRTERGTPPLTEMDKDTSAYWRQLRKLDGKRKSRLLETRHRFKEFGKVKLPSILSK